MILSLDFRIMIKDIHTHHQLILNHSIINLSPSEFLNSAVENQLYSVGVHPWHIDETSADELQLMTEIVEKRNIAAIGECGIDLLKSPVAPFRQMQVFKKQIDLSEKFDLPLIIHNVKAHDIICGLRRDLKPRQAWIIHGFRGKPSVAKMLLDCGCKLSFGENFNADSLKATPEDCLFAETDESKLPIEEIISRLSLSFGKDLSTIITSNSSAVFCKHLVRN